MLHLKAPTQLTSQWLVANAGGWCLWALCVPNDLPCPSLPVTYISESLCFPAKARSTLYNTQMVYEARTNSDTQTLTHASASPKQRHQRFDTAGHCMSAPGAAMFWWRSAAHAMDRPAALCDAIASLNLYKHMCPVIHSCWRPKKCGSRTGHIEEGALDIR